MFTGLIWLEYSQGADTCEHDNGHSVSSDVQKNFVVGQETLKFRKMDFPAWSYLAVWFILSYLPHCFFVSVLCYFPFFLYLV